jgi:hypothetical protein
LNAGAKLSDGLDLEDAGSNAMRRGRAILPVALGSLIAAGCTDPFGDIAQADRNMARLEGDTDRKLERLRAMTEREVIARLGPPQASYTTTTGEAVVTFERTGRLRPESREVFSCRVTLTIAGGQVAAAQRIARRHGDLQQCERLLAPI